MKTERLFYEDAYIAEFDAKVISCEKADGKFKVLLDKTAFFYEGGGQPSDTGTLGDIYVTAVKEENGELWHYTEKALEIGETVLGKIDFERRFYFMQNHSGEHIVSGIVNRLYGFDNVGFHLNEEFVTLDFNGILSREQLNEVELLANEAVWENHTVRAYFPGKAELENINYRSKKELDGDIRIVTIENVDVCACCAPHVAKTGEIGIIKLLDFEKLRGGIRIYMKCGKYAFYDYRSCFENTSCIANELSCKREEVYENFKLFADKHENEKRLNSELKRRLMNSIADAADRNEKCILVDGFDMKDLQILSDIVSKKQRRTVMAVSPSTSGCFFAICGDEAECEAYFLHLKSKFNISGGGRCGMITGIINADIKTVKSV